MTAKRLFVDTLDATESTSDLPETRTIFSVGRKRLVTASAGDSSSSSSPASSPQRVSSTRSAPTTMHYYMRTDVLYTFECALRSGNLDLAMLTANEMVNSENPPRHLWISMFDMCSREVGLANHTVLVRLCQMHRLATESPQILVYLSDAVKLLCQTKKSTVTLDALVVATHPSSAPSLLNFSNTNVSHHINLAEADGDLCNFPVCFTNSCFSPPCSPTSSSSPDKTPPLFYAKVLFQTLFQALHTNNVLLAVEAASAIHHLEHDLRIQMDHLPTDVRKTKLFSWIRNALGRSVEELYRSAQQIRSRPTLACFVLLAQWAVQECGSVETRALVIKRLQSAVSGPFAQRIGDQLLLLADSIVVTMALVHGGCNSGAMEATPTTNTTVALSLYSPSTDPQEIAQRRKFSVLRRLRSENTTKLLPNEMQSVWSTEEVGKSHGVASMPSFEDYWSDLDVVPSEQRLESSLHACAQHMYLDSARRTHRTRSPFAFGACVRHEMASLWFNNKSSAVVATTTANGELATVKTDCA